MQPVSPAVGYQARLVPCHFIYKKKVKMLQVAILKIKKIYVATDKNNHRIFLQGALFYMYTGLTGQGPTTVPGTGTVESVFVTRLQPDCRS